MPFNFDTPKTATERASKVLHWVVEEVIPLRDKLAFWLLVITFIRIVFEFILQESKLAFWLLVTLILSRVVVVAARILRPGSPPPAHMVDISDPSLPSPETYTSERQINAWINERIDEPDKRLALNENYTLSFNVGAAISYSLISGPDAVIQESDVPDEGLMTHWVIISNTVEIIPPTPNVQVMTDEESVNRKRVWTASFDLMIPKQGESDIKEIWIIPRTDEDAYLEVRIFSRQELYRSLSVTLNVAGSEEPQTTFAESSLDICRDVALAPAAHLNMRTPHEWMTPPGVLNVSVIPGMGKAYLNGSVVSAARFEQVSQTTDWRAQSAAVAGPMRNARDALEKFRGNHESYLNDIAPGDLQQRLQTLLSSPDYARPDDWDHLGNDADQEHNRKWDEVSVSGELRKLAYEGHVLYESFFPQGAELRRYIDSMLPGHRINITWQQGMGGDWLAHIPWGLMYLPDPPDPGSPVDAMGFWGMRFRTEYYAHEVKDVTRDLGRLEEARRIYFLYWGGHPQDATAEEARWQRQEFAAWRNQSFVPSTQLAAEAKAELLKVLGSPSPPKTTMLYLFCRCSVGDGNDPALLFGSVSSPENLILRTELSTRSIDDRPLVFANACTTSATDPYVANELEMGFFRRGCRAYIGTESKVSIQLASRFAAIFFNYFYRLVAPEPVAAGEAVAQTRLFLWTQYRNIGGLFYSYVNAYDLFMADDAEIRAMKI